METLGSVSVIASDKTGTLIQNRMTIQRMRVVGTQSKNMVEMQEWTDSEKEFLIILLWHQMLVLLQRMKKKMVSSRGSNRSGYY